MGENLKQTMLGALKWATVDRFAQQGIQFVIGIILARMLDPKDYGLMGMIIIFAQIAYVMVESGLGYALVRTTNITEEHKNTVFYSNCGISVILYTILWFTAPFIAEFFNQPSLVWIARVTFLAILFNALYLVPYNMLGRALDYKTLTKINFTATILSGLCGITMAYYQMGVWALVMQQTSYHFFRMVMFHIYSTWRPSILFSWDILKGYAGFSVNMLGTSLLTVLFNNIYTLLLGRYYPVKQVGYYTQGNKMSETVNFTFLAILSSAYNIMARIHEETERMVNVIRTFTKNVSNITIPLSVFLIVTARPLFFILFGEKWLSAVPYFQMMMAANMFTPLYQIKVHALNARGRSKSTFIIELVKRSIILISIVVSLWLNWGIMVMLLFYIGACWLAYLLSAVAIKKETNHYFRHQILDIMHGVMAGIIVGAGVYAASAALENKYATFTLQIVTAMILFAAYQSLFNSKMIDEAKHLIQEKVDE